MSPVSQTPVGAGHSWMRLAAIGVVIVTLVALAAAPSARQIAAFAVSGRLHAPDLALLASLPPAIKIHLGAALAALVLGGVLMAMRKGRRLHRAAGWAWVGLVTLVAGSSLFITTLRPGRFSVLHLLTGWTLIVLPVAVTWAKRHHVARHRRAMMGLFYGGFALNLFIAFIPGRVLWRVFLG
ncbi:MAG TPA: DUF2306 domain-containing protein [Phenylobacterium sp.]|jgi:uncharacterized membrane protein|uniref:DUF2306 domain-containing protein n=1 Tax=Phenylobacterium sp. TaxID=1871053 RepID=UPI002D443025|nr:DUF2306 domain-containing protein [Phenylobacterium sp.]HZZ70576.1 DUF2306 domain-containing protein [Phenylobacterium sp.]